MDDDEAKLCWRLAGNRRHDWWNIKREHTPFEWNVQIARSLVEPWGEERADLRAARNTTQLLLAQAVEQLDDEEAAELCNTLRFYLKSNQQPETVLTPAQAAAAHR